MSGDECSRVERMIRFLFDNKMNERKCTALVIFGSKSSGRLDYLQRKDDIKHS